MAKSTSWIIYEVWIFICLSGFIHSFNGDDVELECPDECDCHYFRINWVTDCSESNLTEIPYEEISQNVYVLDMNGNNVSKLDIFSKGIKLRRLQLAHNMLTRIQKASFQGLEYLIDVDLSANRIATLDSDAFEENPGLLTLELQENNLLEITEGPFLISRSLQYLDISYCNLSSISSEFFANVTALHTLDLSGNPLVTLDQEIFDPLTTLETLKLNDCQLTYIADSAFIFQEVLKRLELSGNAMGNIDLTFVIGTMSHLEYLDLRNSQITKLPDDSFSNSTWLQTLILAENELTDLDVAIILGNNLRHLETLDLSQCHLRGPLSEDAFANVTKLKTLRLSGNPLYASDLQMALGPLSELEKLFLSNCSLKHLPNSFRKLIKLEELDISHNPLSDLFTKLLTSLEKLEYLNMGYSNLSHIGPETFSKMTSMRRLVLSGNDLNSLETGLFGNLTHLESLELNNCGLRRPFNTTVFFNNFSYTELKELKLAGNPLLITKDSYILPKQLSRLKSLDLSNCNLSFFPDNAFKQNDNLISLNLAGNIFNSTPGSLKFLQLLPKLEHLDLGNNNMTTISPHIFVKNSKISSLRLVGNPWKCDCHIAEMWDWASMIKGDLSILVGSKTSPDDFTLKGAKRKKSLLCNYEDDRIKEIKSSNRTVAGRRPFVKPRGISTANRTWAKYVRESGCELVVRILTPMNLVRDAPMDGEFYMGLPVWVLGIVGVSLIVTTGVVAGLMGCRRARRDRLTVNSQKCNIY